MLFSLKDGVENLLYAGYESLLAKEIKELPVPSHVAIIMDGNRRYAKGLGLDRYYGHLKGADTTERVLDWSFDLGVKQLTVYAFSTENFTRSRKEQQQLFELIGLKFDEICRDERTHKRRMRVRILGNINLLPRDLRSAALRAERITRNYNGVYLNVALAYGGRQELVDATKRLAEKIKSGDLSLRDINEEVISNHMYPNEGTSIPKVDLVIRTGGQERISNFLPWQTSGSECAAYFCAPYWPEFRKIDFLRAIRTYQTREHERQRNTVLRIVKLLRTFSSSNMKGMQVEVEDVIKLTKRVINLPREEIIRILRELSYHNIIAYETIRW